MEGAKVMSTTIFSIPQATTTTWSLDPVDSIAEFKVKHMMISNVKGQFTGVSGVLNLDEGDVGNSRVEVTIDARSINTRDPQRDAHLKSADFFDVEQYPTLSFWSTRIIRRADGNLTVAGDLTMRGVTREVLLEVEGFTPPAKDPWGGVRIGLSAATKINRKDYGLTWNAALEAGGILVGDEVMVTLDVQFVKAT
jgi:polyisoprenoid-binding protein YceI